MPRSHSTIDKLLNPADIDFEASVLAVHATAKTWLSPRQSAQPLLKETSASHWPLVSVIAVTPIQDMHMLRDRWLVVVYQEGAFELWDCFPEDGITQSCGLSSNGAWVREASQPVRRLQGDVQGACISSAACIDPKDNTIILAVAKQV